jgi:exopolysaccharide biosynthesis polyprenyl glycosylphosphotransferase
MNNSLELTGELGRVSPSVTGRVLIVGARCDSRRLARRLNRGSWSGLQVVGYVDAGHSRSLRGPSRGRQLAVHPCLDPVPVLGGVDQLDELVDRAKATHVVVAISGRPAQRLRPRLAQLSHADVAVHWISEKVIRRGSPLPVAEWSWVRPAWPIRWDRAAKRVVDALAAAVGLILLAPLFAVVGLFIALTSGRPVFYTQDRVGQGGRIFRMVKFRSMRRDAEGETGPIWATDHDARCTPIGAWLRRTNIDELPQLINVLLGQMSLVGPRPERPVFVEQFRREIPDYDLRHAVAGGMTGWAQVHGWRGRTSLRKRIQYDLDYIERWSFWFDFRVLVMTVQHVFGGKISWNTPPRRPEP